MCKERLLRSMKSGMSDKTTGLKGETARFVEAIIQHKHLSELAGITWLWPEKELVISIMDMPGKPLRGLSDVVNHQQGSRLR